MTSHTNRDEFDFLSNKFIEWLKHNGATISSKIDLVDLRSHNAGRGVVANQDIEEDEELFRIPKSSILTISSSTLPDSIANTVEDPWLALILAMVYEYQQQADSRWKPYFDILPLEFQTLMYWSLEELQFLQGSAVVNKIGKEKADETFTTHVLPLIRQHETIFNATALTDSDILSLCHRMGSTIMAYAFDMEDTAQAASKNEQDGWEEDSSDEETEIQSKGMVPLADMLNADATRNNARLFYEADAVALKALRPIPAGEEVFNDYGPLPRADLLRRYGYVTDNYAPYDVVEVSLELIKRIVKDVVQNLSDGDVDSRLDYLQEQDLLDDAYDVSHPTHEEGQFSDELKILLNSLTISTSDFEKLRAKDRLPKPILSSDSARLLESVLTSRQAMYAQPIDTDAADASEATTSDPRKEILRGMATQVIAGEKAVLASALSTLIEVAGHEKKRKLDESGQTKSRSHHPMSKKMKQNGT